jgi:type IV pilus assembly protein PilM
MQQLAGHLKLKQRAIAASISGYEVMIKKIELPTMSEEELEGRMKAELGQYIPYNVDEVDTDVQVLGPSKERANYMEVLLVAAKKESINDHVNLVRLSGLDPSVIDVDFFALSNAFEATHGFGEETVALIDIGASKAIMNIVHRGAPLFTRGISIGGNQITEGIREDLRVTPEDAERIKLGEVPQGASTGDLEDIFVSVVRNWVSECKRAIDFYYSNYPDKRIDKAFISGGSCRIPGIDKAFEENMDVPVEVFNPLAAFEYDAKAFDPEYIEYIGPQMAISAGLALRRAKER